MSVSVIREHKPSILLSSGATLSGPSQLATQLSSKPSGSDLILYDGISINDYGISLGSVIRGDWAHLAANTPYENRYFTGLSVSNSGKEVTVWYAQEIQPSNAVTNPDKYIGGGFRYTVNNGTATLTSDSKIREITLLSANVVPGNVASGFYGAGTVYIEKDLGIASWESAVTGWEILGSNYEYFSFGSYDMSHLSITNYNSADGKHKVYLYLPKYAASPTNQKNISSNPNIVSDFSKYKYKIVYRVGSQIRSVDLNAASTPFNVSFYFDNNVKWAYVEYAICRQIVNNNPTLTLNAPQDGRTIYENDILNLAGAANDVDAGNVVSIKYKIDGGTTRAISANISNGTAVSFAKNLTFKSGILYDGTMAITSQLAEGSQHVVTAWAEDDQGGKSPEISRTFYVVANRPAQLTINAFVEQSNLINTDKITINGNVSDPDNNPVTVQFKIGSGQFQTIYNGQSGAFTFDIELSQFEVGANMVTLQAIDSHAAITQQVLKVTKTADETPINEAVAYFKVTPPNGTTDGIVIWVEREEGDLVVSAEVSMTNNDVEQFMPMTLERTVPIRGSITEDQFAYEHTGPATNVIVRLTLNRTNTVSTHAVKLFSGVLS